MVDGWVDTAGEVNLSGNSWDRGGIKPDHLVIHGTAGGSDAYGVAQYMGTAGVSTHFVISRDGTIVQCVSCDRAAWANAPLMNPRLNFVKANINNNPNYWTISVELAKPDTTNQIDISDAQFASVVALSRLICDTYGIPKRRSDGTGGIIGHCDINSVDRADCPGTFPWDSFFSALNPAPTQNPPQEEDMTIELNTPGVSTYFAPSADGYWRCNQTNHRIGGAILSFYKRVGGNSLCGLTYLGLPLTDATQIDAKNHPEVFAQRFERGFLIEDPHHVYDSPPQGGDVYLMHLDKGYGYDQITSTLAAQVNQLNQDITSLKQQLANSGNTADLQKEIAVLQGKLNQINALSKS